MATTLPPSTLPPSTGRISSTFQPTPTTAERDIPYIDIIIGLGVGLGVMCIVCVVLVFYICMMKRKQAKADHYYEPVDEPLAKIKSKSKSTPQSSGQGVAKPGKPKLPIGDGAPEIPTGPPKKKNASEIPTQPSEKKTGTPEIHMRRPTKQQVSSESEDESSSSSSSSSDDDLDGIANPSFTQDEHISETLDSSETNVKDVKTKSTPLNDTNLIQEEIYEPVQTPPVIRHASKTSAVLADVHSSSCNPAVSKTLVFDEQTTVTSKGQDIPVKSIKKQLSKHAVEDFRKDDGNTQDENKREIYSSSEIYEARVRNIDETAQSFAHEGKVGPGFQPAMSAEHDVSVKSIKQTTTAHNATEKRKVYHDVQPTLTKAHDLLVKSIKLPSTDVGRGSETKEESETQDENKREIYSASEIYEAGIKKTIATETSVGCGKTSEKKEDAGEKHDSATMSVDTADTASAGTSKTRAKSDEGSVFTSADPDFDEDWNINLGSFSEDNQEIYFEVKKRFNDLKTKSYSDI